MSCRADDSEIVGLILIDHALSLFIRNSYFCKPVLTHGALRQIHEKVVKVTGRYYVPALFQEIERIKSRSASAQLVVQSTQNFWKMHEDDGGVLRSEVVGFNKTLADWIFRAQNEAIGIPMERILALRVMDREKAGDRVERFDRMNIEPTRNAEGVMIEFL